MEKNYLSDVISLLTLEKKREMSFDNLVHTIQLKRSQLAEVVPTNLVTERVRAAIVSGKDMGLIRTIPYNIDRGIEKAKLAFAMPARMGNMSRNATALSSGSSSEDLTSDDINDFDKIIEALNTSSKVKVEDGVKTAQASTSQSINSKRPHPPDNQGTSYSSDYSGSNDESQDSDSVQISPTVAAYTNPYFSPSKAQKREKRAEIAKIKQQAKRMRGSDPC